MAENAPVIERLKRLDPAVVESLLKLARRTGWLKSAISGFCQDAVGEPTPWYTYGAIHFLAGRVKPDFNVFEFGSGASTLWWAKRVKHVATVEHHKAWHARMAKRLPANVTYRYVQLKADGDYCRAALATKQKFDVLVIDGRDRVNSLKYSIDTLHDHSVVVWDNANRAQYAEGYALLEARGFKRLEFIGPGPINTKEWMTGIFYRPDNCLGI